MELSRRSLLLGTAGAAGLATLNPALAQTASVAPGVAPFMTHLHARNKRALDGPWHYILDPFDVAGRKPRSRRNFWENVIESAETGLIEYEWASSPIMQIPGDWNTAETELTYYDDPVYFRRTFTVEQKGNTRRILYFEAVNYRATVWLDGEEIGRHEGGFTPFQFDITDRVEPGKEHSLVVKADSRHGPDTLPALDFDWKNFGGITRSVWLVDVPRTYIRDVWVRLEGEQIRIDVALDGPQGATAQISVPELDIDARLQVPANGRATIGVTPKNLALWSPENPKLYDITVRAGDDELTDRVGLRTIEARGREVLLNGEPVFLRGISMHEEAIGPEATRTVSLAEARALLEEARALGCNFVRLAHYPHAEHLAKIADEMGIMLWAEIPVYWEEVDYENPRTLALARAMMAELVTRDRSRASVVMWSVANETPQIPARTRFLETVIADVRALDPTRLITAALNKNVDVGGVRDGESRIVVKDPLGASLDVVAINQYEGWYGKRHPGEIQNVSFRNSYEKPMMFSEFGAGALYGHRGPKEERWTEEYQAWLFEETVKVVDATPGCVGLAPWLLKDFRSPRRWHGRFQELWNRKGLIDPAGRRKLAFDALRTYYERKAAG